MSRPKLEVADIFRRHGAVWRAANKVHLSLGQRRVMTAIEACRTAAPRGHVERCSDCAHTRIAYNPCRNRHCPKCQWQAAAAWLAARQAELLPVPYFHVGFTLPAAICPIAYQNKAKLYGLLFPAAGETLTPLPPHPQHPGAQHRILTVLDTRGPHLQHHPPRPAHLGSEPPAPSSRALHRTGWRTIAGWSALDCLQARLLSSGSRALAPVPAPVLAESTSHARHRPTPVL